MRQAGAMISDWRRMLRATATLAPPPSAPPAARPPSSKLGYGEPVFRATLLVHAEKPRRVYIGEGCAAIIPTTLNLATKEQRKDEKLGSMDVRVVGYRPQEDRIEVVSLQTKKKRVLRYDDL